MTSQRGPLLITGASGLVGTALGQALVAAGVEIRGLDIARPPGHPEYGPEYGDVRDKAALRAALAGCRGAVHLAALSRVAIAQRQPRLCRQTNLGGTLNLLAAAAEMTGPDGRPPWILFASSREVYGHAQRLPVREDHALAPVNVYGRAKLAAERRVLEARAAGVPTAIARLSNVFGTLDDHPDRVIPAFVRAAAAGETLWVEGGANCFDFTPLSDSVAGLMALIARLEAEPRSPPPPMHFTTGRGTRLDALARMTVEAAGSRAPIHDAPPRDFDIGRFVGDPARAEAELGWRAEATLEDGLAAMLAQARGRDAAAAE